LNIPVAVATSLVAWPRGRDSVFRPELRFFSASRTFCMIDMKASPYSLVPDPCQALMADTTSTNIAASISALSDTIII
jgi:hypothetical protein